MEDLRNAFEGEPAKLAPTHEVAPPKRPEKRPLHEGTEGTPTSDQKTAPHAQPPPNTGVRRSSTAPPVPDHATPVTDTADVAFSEPHSRPAPPPRDDAAAVEATRAQRRQDRERREEQRREDQRLMREEMEDLVAQLGDAKNRADQAERVVDELTQLLDDKFREDAAADTHHGDGESADAAFAALQAENKKLRAELDEARSHIFSLQPYRNDLTPKEVGQDFDDLVNGVSDWVTNLMEPILDDDERLESVLIAAKKRSADLHKLRRYVHSQGDLVNGCLFPETDIDILIAVVMRFLQDNIFQKILFGAVPDAVEMVTFVEGSMQTNVEPKRDLFALRSWRAEALNAIICSPDYQRARNARARELTGDLAGHFKIFRKEKDWNRLCVGVLEDIVKPAVRLHEKLMTSTHHFYLDLDTYVVWNASQELEVSPDFVRHLPALRCENILQNRKPFALAKLDPRPGKEQLYRELANVATVVPALYMRQVGKGDVIKEPTIVRPQQVLVAWGPEEKRERFVGNGERTLIHHLCFSQRERQEGGMRALMQWR